MVLFARLFCFVSGRFLGFFLGRWLFVHGFSVGPDNLSQSAASACLEPNTGLLKQMNIMPLSVDEARADHFLAGFVYDKLRFKRGALFLS
jgi:hypothetical protein